MKLIVFAKLVGLLEQVIHAVFLERHDLYHSGVLHAEQKRYRRVRDRGSLGPSDGLHPGNAWNREDALGQFVQYQKICRIAQIVIGLDHQDLGYHHSRLRKMSLCGRYTPALLGISLGI